jgi:hypothetical protein
MRYKDVIRKWQQEGWNAMVGAPSKGDKLDLEKSLKGINA